METSPIFAVEIVISDPIRSVRFVPFGVRLGNQFIENARLECTDRLANRPVSLSITEANDARMQLIDKSIQLVAIDHRRIHGIRHYRFELPCRHTDKRIELLDQYSNQIIPIHNLFADFILLRWSSKLPETLRTAMLYQPIAKTAT